MPFKTGLQKHRYRSGWGKPIFVSVQQPTQEETTMKFFEALNFLFKGLLFLDGHLTRRDDARQ